MWTLDHTLSLYKKLKLGLFPCLCLISKHYYYTKIQAYCLLLSRVSPLSPLSLTFRKLQWRLEMLLLPWKAQRRRFHAQSLEGIWRNKKEDYTLSEDVWSCSFAGTTECKMKMELLASTWWCILHQRFCAIGCKLEFDLFIFFSNCT